MKFALGALLVVGVIVAVIFFNAAPETPPDPEASPTGPATVLGGIKRRAQQRQLKARQKWMTEISDVVRTDGGAAPASP
jgi:hypothetical protein